MRQSFPCAIPVSHTLPFSSMAFVPENNLGVTIYPSPISVAYPFHSSIHGKRLASSPSLPGSPSFPSVPSLPGSPFKFSFASSDKLSQVRTTSFMVHTHFFFSAFHTQEIAPPAIYPDLSVQNFAELSPNSAVPSG